MCDSVAKKIYCKAKNHVYARAVLARACQLVEESSSIGDIYRAFEAHHGTVSHLAGKVTNTPKLTEIVEELLYTYRIAHRSCGPFSQ